MFYRMREIDCEKKWGFLISDEEEEIKFESEKEGAMKGDLQNAVRTLQSKLDDLTTCQGLIGECIDFYVSIFCAFNHF